MIDVVNSELVSVLVAVFVTVAMLNRFEQRNRLYSDVSYCPLWEGQLPP